VCDITGTTYTGMDGEYGVEYGQCEYGHEFSIDDVPGLSNAIDAYERAHEEDVDRYEIPAELCPVCNGTAKSVIVKRIKQEIVRLNLTVEDLK
jgi:hypothetical protein